METNSKKRLALLNNNSIVVRINIIFSKSTGRLSYILYRKDGTIRML